MRTIQAPDGNTLEWGWEDYHTACLQARLLFEVFALPFEVVEVTPVPYPVRYAITLVGSDAAVRHFLPFHDRATAVETEREKQNILANTPSLRRAFAAAAERASPCE